MNISFNKFNPETELVAQRELFKECFPETVGTSISSIPHYNWKFHSKLGDIQTAEFTANSDSDMLGYYAAIPYKYKYKNSFFNAAMVCDVMTGVKARGKGVFTKLGIYSTNEFAKLGFDFSTGYPIRKEVIPGHLKAGWEINFELPLFARFIKFNSLLKKKNIEFLAPVFNFIYSLISNFLSFIFIKKNKDLKFETVTSDKLDTIDGLFDFYEKWSDESMISLQKDFDFLKWRLGAPDKFYYLCIARSNEKIVGVLIAREIEKEGVPSMGILDISMLNKYRKFAPLLTREIVNVSKKVNAELILVMISSFWFKNYSLFRNVFFKSPFKFYFIIKQLNKSINSTILRDEKNWHLMWIDSDDL